MRFIWILFCLLLKKGLFQALAVNYAYEINLNSDNTVSHQNISQAPLFYGWFFSEDPSKSIQSLSQKYFSLCYEQIAEFRYFIEIHCEESDVDDPYEYFKKPLDPNTGLNDPFFHITSKFCGRDEDTCFEYTNEVGQFIGQSFETHIPGFFFTKRTYGFRVNLTEDQAKIFSNETTSKLYPLSNGSNEQTILNFVEQQGGKSEYPGIHFSPDGINFKPTKTRAHITLGIAPNILPEQTGYDLIEIIGIESHHSTPYKDWQIVYNNSNSNNLNSSILTLRHYYGFDGVDDDIFVIYPNFQLIGQSTFMAYL